MLGDGCANFPCLWGVPEWDQGALLGCVLVPLLSRDLCMAPVQFGWRCSWGGSSQGWHFLGKYISSLELCFKQPCIQSKRTKLCVMWKLQKVGFFKCEIFYCFPEKIKTVFQQFCWQTFFFLIFLLGCWVFRMKATTALSMTSKVFFHLVHSLETFDTCPV